MLTHPTPTASERPRERDILLLVVTGRLYPAGGAALLGMSLPQFKAFAADELDRLDAMIATVEA